TQFSVDGKLDLKNKNFSAGYRVGVESKVENRNANLVVGAGVEQSFIREGGRKLESKPSFSVGASSNYSLD
ncbi:hypothetical protein NPIL_142161, partial [Nephila pilipes]